MKRVLIGMCLFLLIGWARPALAFTPESGVWWNPDEPGRGYLLEIQDNRIFLTVFVYNQNGTQLWYTSSGLLQGNSAYLGTLDLSLDGQCIGCSHRLPNTIVGQGGGIQLNFTTQISGLLTWSGGTVPIERFNFGFGNTEERMLGEWQTVLDFNGYPGVSYPFSGDVLVIDRLASVSNQPGFRGCRADDAQQARCSNFALNNHDLTGFYSATGNSGVPYPAGSHVFVVNDSPNFFLTYFVRVGSNRFEGVVSIYRKDSVPVDFYPVRGFRTASGARVVTGIGPDEAPDAGKQRETLASIVARLPDGGLALDAKAGGGMDAAAVEARYDIDVQALLPQLQAMTKALEAERTER